MKHLFERIKASYREFRNIKAITICAMFGALSIILGYFSIQIGDFLKIGFSSLPNEAVAYLFGPVVAPLFGGIMDILKYIIKPTGAFFPGFTITAMVAGLINGFLLYKRPVKLSRILVTKFLVIVICDIVLNTIWLSILYGKGFMVLLPMRAIKNLIMWPIEGLLLFTMLKMLDATGLLKEVQTSKNSII